MSYIFTGYHGTSHVYYLTQYICFAGHPGTLGAETCHCQWSLPWTVGCDVAAWTTGKRTSKVSVML